MNKDQVEGKVKDVAGRVERQAGEWTGNKEAEARGAAKQVEGKVQGAWGDVKDAGQKAADKAKSNRPTDETAEVEKERRQSLAQSGLTAVCGVRGYVIAGRPRIDSVQRRLGSREGSNDVLSWARVIEPSCPNLPSTSSPTDQPLQL